MYEKFYGFRERPFDLTSAPRYLVVTGNHREALSNLQYAIASRKGIALLVGEAGTGKTTIIRAAIAKNAERTHYVHLDNPALTRVEFVEMLADRFGLDVKARSSKTELLLQLERLLHQRRLAGETTVLIVDEAQSLPMELLEELRLLSNIEADGEKLMPLIIAGQPEIADRLNDVALRQLKQRVALRCELHPLDLVSTVRYVAGRITIAGGKPAEVFTREAVMLIHERSRGIPRTINVIADNALVTGFAAQQRPVATELVREVCRDFDISQPRDAIPPRSPEPSKRPLESPSRVPALPKRSSPVLTESDQDALDSAVWPTLRAQSEKISNWAAPAFGALGLKKR